MNWILDLRKSLSIPHTLNDLIPDKSKFKEMSLLALNDPSSATNAIMLNQDDFY